jgi:hypothetical protein
MSDAQPQDEDNVRLPSEKPPLRPIGTFAVAIDEDTGNEHQLFASPNTLEIGDIVLVAGSKWNAKLTRWLQAPHIFHADHRQWTHVGLYIGDGMLVDKHINPFVPWLLRSLDEFCGDNEFLVRRSRSDLNDESRVRLLRTAILHLKRRYAYLKAIGFGLRSIAGGIMSNARGWCVRHGIPFWPLKEHDGWIGAGEMLCTDLVDECHRVATRNTLIPLEHVKLVEYMLTPAALSWTPSLQDVPVLHLDVVSIPR